MISFLVEAEKQILGTLLIDFSDRKLDAKQLRSGYQGPQITDVCAAVCNNENIDKVDFDLAISDLEKKKLIKTGPYEAYKNRPGSRVAIIGFYSKREYASLTELGYKAAKTPPNRPERVQRMVNNVNINGGQFSNLQLAVGGDSVQKMDAVSGADSGLLLKLVEILEKQGQTVSVSDRSNLQSAIDEASEGNGKEAKKLLEKVCGPAWDAIQPVMWPIFGEILRKSLGL